MFLSFHDSDARLTFESDRDRSECDSLATESSPDKKRELPDLAEDVEEVWVLAALLDLFLVRVGVDDLIS